MSYSVRFPTVSIEKHVEKLLRRLSRPDQLRIKEAMESLGRNPRPEGNRTKILKPPIDVFRFVARYRLRMGDYRILYDIDESQRVIWILDVRRRTEKTYL